VRTRARWFLACLALVVLNVTLNVVPALDSASETKAKADWWIAKYPPERKQSASIPLLWLVQKQEGWVSEPAIRHLAELLEMPVIRVLEVATFYTMFQLTPVGRVAFVQLCGTTPCMLRGANDLKAVLREKIGEPHHLDRTLLCECIRANERDAGGIRRPGEGKGVGAVREHFHTAIRCVK